MEADYGATIKRLRMSSGMTQQMLFESMLNFGVQWSQSTLSKVESGARPLRFGEGVAMAASLGVSLQELAGISDQSDDRQTTRSHELDMIKQFLEARMAYLLEDSAGDQPTVSERELR